MDAGSDDGVSASVGSADASAGGGAGAGAQGGGLTGLIAGESAAQRRVVRRGSGTLQPPARHPPPSVRSALPTASVARNPAPPPWSHPPRRLPHHPAQVTHALPAAFQPPSPCHAPATLHLSQSTSPLQCKSCRINSCT